MGDHSSMVMGLGYDQFSRKLGQWRTIIYSQCFMGVHSWMLDVGFWSVFENALAVKRNYFDFKGIHRLVLGLNFEFSPFLDYGFSHVKSAEILIWMPWPMWIWVGTPPVLYFISSGLQAHRLHGCDHPTCARSLTFLIHQRGLLSIIAFQVQDM